MNASNETFVRAAQIQLARWMIREGHPTMLAIEESRRIAACRSEMQYLRVQRTGSRFLLDRRTKQGLWSLWQNARKHTAFAFIHVQGIDVVDDVPEAA